MRGSRKRKGAGELKEYLVDLRTRLTALAYPASSPDST